jgi:SOS response regulatory protein OraA/RecX
MKVLSNKLYVAAASIVAAGSLVAVGSGVVSAATPTTTTAKSGIARYTVMSDRLNAESEVLGMSNAQLETALQTSSFSSVLTSKGFTKDTFRTKVKAEISSELLAQGYSQAQVTKAMTHMHHHHMDKKTS